VVAANVSINIWATPFWKRAFLLKKISTINSWRQTYLSAPCSHAKNILYLPNLDQKKRADSPDSFYGAPGIRSFQNWEELGATTEECYNLMPAN